MEITILNPSSDVFTVKGLTVIIDVFRAFSTSCYIAAKNPKKIIPVGSIAQAFKLNDNLENVLLVGEREGIKIDGFDFGNSPTEIEQNDLKDKVIVHTTSAGTKGLLRQTSQNEVITGSFVNCSAIIKYINQQDPDRLYLYCTVINREVYGQEDYLFADYLTKLIRNEETDFQKILDTLKVGSGAKFKEGGIGPESDFDYCMDLNRFDFILKRKIVDELEYKIELERVNI